MPLCNCANNPNCTSQTPCSCTSAGGEGISLDNFKSEKGESFVSVIGIDLNTYRFYPCGVDTPWGTNGDCLTTSTACQFDSHELQYYSIGETNEYSIEEAVLSGDRPYVKFIYTGGSDNRLCTIKVICSELEALSFLDEDTPLEYNLEFSTPKVCPEGGGNAPVLLIFVILVLFLAAVTYSVVGVMLMVFWKGARGFEIIPNLGFWKDFPFLFKDGFLFVFSCIPAARSRIGGQQAYSSLK